MELYINNNWKYNKAGTYRCFNYHIIPDGVYHIHLQVSEETEKIK